LCCQLPLALTLFRLKLLLMLVARLTLTFTLPRPQLQLPNIAPAAAKPTPHARPVSSALPGYQAATPG
jgi:hypothetical protein